MAWALAPAGDEAAELAELELPSTQSGEARSSGLTRDRDHAYSPHDSPGTRANHAGGQAGQAEAACLAGGELGCCRIAITATLAFRHPGGDPGGDPRGVRRQTLRSISVAVPSDAKVQSHSAGGPIWDSCDGRPGTQGWSDVINAFQFTSARSAATVVANAEATMKIAGWTLISTPSTPLGPSARWTKPVSGNVVAQALLAVGTRGPNRHSPSYWDLTASAPPAGRRASGC